VVAVRESFGNCPQYIHIRDLEVVPATPLATEVMNDLDQPSREAIEAADTFFVATGGGAVGVNISHRGGRPGFVRLGDNTLTIPDFSGNRYFNTLGNMLLDARAGAALCRFRQRRCPPRARPHRNRLGGTRDGAPTRRRAVVARECDARLAPPRRAPVPLVAAGAIAQPSADRKLERACGIVASSASRNVSNPEECIGWVLASVLDAEHLVSAFDHQAIGLPRLALRGRFHMCSGLSTPCSFRCSISPCFMLTQTSTLGGRDQRPRRHRLARQGPLRVDSAVRSARLEGPNRVVSGHSPNSTQQGELPYCHATVPCNRVTCRKHDNARNQLLAVIGP
jgi:hypothetical protein